jgi:sterol desaturase/sphingolipid hydroxylase (fatty acid hydroxylase superfamily)
MDQIVTRLDSLAQAVSPWLFAFAFMTALELLLPRERGSIARRGAGLLFWALWLPTMVAVYAGFRALWVAMGIEPLIVLPLTLEWTGWFAVIAAPFAGAAFYDFFFYWFHRAQHKWFWRFHAVHHSIGDLNATNAYHHISEPFFQALFILVPTSLIVSDSGPVIPVMATIIYLHASFIHSSTSLHLGPLRCILVDNRFHRIHHSLEERHFDRNFGAMTTLWDRLFGTAHFPEKDEWPATGLAGVDQPRDIGAWLTLPFRMRDDGSAKTGNPMPDAAHSGAFMADLEKG